MRQASCFLFILDEEDEQIPGVRKSIAALVTGGGGGTYNGGHCRSFHMICTPSVCHAADALFPE